MATHRQKKAFDKVVGNGGNITKAMKEVGYSENTANTPQKLTTSIGWKELLEQNGLDDATLSKKHSQLLNSTKIEHMVFPLGPLGADDLNLSGAKPNQAMSEMKEADLPEQYKERTTLTDEEIKSMLIEVGCRVRRIVHGNTARHVYFWAQDSKALKDALDMAYKLKGLYAPEKKELSGKIETSNPELDALVAEAELLLKKKKTK